MNDSIARGALALCLLSLSAMAEDPGAFGNAGGLLFPGGTGGVLSSRAILPPTAGQPQIDPDRCIKQFSCEVHREKVMTSLGEVEVAKDVFIDREESDAWGTDRHVLEFYALPKPTSASDTLDSATRLKAAALLGEIQCKIKQLEADAYPSCSDDWRKSRQAVHQATRKERKALADSVVYIGVDILDMVDAMAPYVDGHRVLPDLDKLVDERVALVLEKLTSAKAKVLMIDMGLPPSSDPFGARALKALRRLKHENHTQLFSANEIRKRQSEYADLFQFASVSVGELKDGKGRDGRALVYCMSSKRQQDDGWSQLLVLQDPHDASAMIRLQDSTHCARDERSMPIAILEAIGAAVPPLKAQRATLHIGENDGTQGVMLPRLPKGSLKTLSAKDVLHKDFPISALEGKIILLGANLAEADIDKHQLQGEVVPGTEVIATAIKTLADDDLYETTETEGTLVEIIRPDFLAPFRSLVRFFTGNYK